eukprot:722601_1
MASQFRFIMRLDQPEPQREDEADAENSNYNYNNEFGSDFDIHHGGNNGTNNECEKWIFGGDRYPVEAPELWDSKYGRHVIVPVNLSMVYHMCIGN